MLERKPDLGDGVLEFSASGHVTGADYESVLIPGVEEVLSRHSKVRLLYHLGADFERFDAAALWDDAKVGLEHVSAWDRMALVTDVEWIRLSAKVLGFALPGRVRLFANAEIDQARAWLTE